MLAIAEWVTRSGISVVFALALLWWVLNSQTQSLERIASNQAQMATMLERLAIRVDACAPSR
ncbi:MAG: hypothetical protein EBQ56_00425 [Proteobacteria bacterium]|jgi:hypothetical protein|nr:hypothetical protein [Actinomycetota bacterium]NBY46244.1 hypothetical protein [Pseudomonadota bacterium]